MNLGKRGCADDSNLCEIVSVVPEKKKDSVSFLDKLLMENNFVQQYRKQLEKVAAMGTAGAYISLKDAVYVQSSDGRLSVKGGSIKINYVDADGIIPLTVENDVVTECAFFGSGVMRGQKRTVLVEFIQENGRYRAETTVFDSLGKLLENEKTILQLGEIRPFAIMTNAEVNNIRDMEGYGKPKLYDAIPILMALDLCYNLLYGDLDKGSKLVFINELLACIKKNPKTNKPELTAQQKEIFILLGDEAGKLPEQKSIVQEYNPEIRINEITKVFELLLSLYSLIFGYGTKKYTFENGQIKTATEYIGTRQDCMQELNKQRAAAERYIREVVRAAMWYSNTFHGTEYDIEEVLLVKFDDSYVEDRQTKIEKIRNDALSFDIEELTVMYLMEAYNLPRETALKMIAGMENDGDENELEE